MKLPWQGIKLKKVIFKKKGVSKHKDTVDIIVEKQTETNIII